MITEEFVTTKIVDWLKLNGWRVLCFDFPQSGTGFSLRPNNSSSKSRDVIIPDIVAMKGNCGVLFENKDRFFLGDFNKVEKLRTSNNYNDSLKIVFGGNLPKEMRYGIAFPRFDYQLEKAKPFLNKIDFLMTVTLEGKIGDHYNPKDINFYGQDIRKTDNES